MSSTALTGEVKYMKAAKLPCKMGDRGTSDVIVRVRTDDGRDSRFYCHSQVLIKQSKYFADRLSEDWPTCQILDSRNCVEVFCKELDFNFNIIVLRILYLEEPHTWPDVRNALGILRVADYLGCYQIVQSCVFYLEAVPWGETEEEEILRIIPALGPQYQAVLARLQPVDPTAIVGIFISTIHFATSSSCELFGDSKKSAQEQLEYMLTEDDDMPLLSINNAVVRSEVAKCMESLSERLDSLVLYLSNKSPDNTVPHGRRDMSKIQEILSDISWICQILAKLEMMKDLVNFFVIKSCDVIKAVDLMSSAENSLDVELKVLDVGCKVLEAISSGTVVLQTSRRLHVLKVWLPFVRKLRTQVELFYPFVEEVPSVRMDDEIWKSLESSIISILLTLPSGDQANFLAQWLSSPHIRYPELSEVFEVWCYRSKVAKRRLAL